MKIKFTRLALILFIVVLANEVRAQFNLSGEFRPRTEYRKGLKLYRQLMQRQLFLLPNKHV